MSSHSAKLSEASKFPLQGTTARTYKAEKALPHVHGNLNKFVPNGDGRLWLHSGNGFNGADGTDEKMFNSQSAVRPIISDIECERFVCLAPGESKTLVFSLTCPICATGLAWPLPHCSLEFLFMLQPDPKRILADSTPGNPSSGTAQNPTVYYLGQPRSERWYVTLPRLIGDLVKLADTADTEFSPILSGPGLHHSFSSWRYLQATVSS